MIELIPWTEGSKSDTMIVHLKSPKRKKKTILSKNLNLQSYKVLTLRYTDKN